MAFSRENTEILVPALSCCSEDYEAVHLVMETVDGVNLAGLENKQREIVLEELEQHRRTMRRLRSSNSGGPSGLVFLLYRATSQTLEDHWNPYQPDNVSFVFYLSQYNM